MNLKQKIGLFTGIILFLLFDFIIELNPAQPEITTMAAIALLMAVWWITEAVPLAATSLIPLILFPLLNLLPGDEIASAYMNSVIFLFLGGFLLAIAMEKWGLHKRIALRIIMVFGGTPNAIIFGFMVSAAFLSMWISNTATAVMMLPIALAIISKIENDFGDEKSKNFSRCLLLTIAYSCTLGGIATLVGTPPNLALVRITKIMFPASPDISFGKWMLLALPISIVMLFLMNILLTKFIFRLDKKVRIEKEFLRKEYHSLGKFSFEEKLITIIFSLTALLWIFRTDLDFGLFQIPGWANIFNTPAFIDDGTVAITMAFILFLIPAKDSEGKTTILDVGAFQKVPWNIILLFGGGFALATGFAETGLSDFIGNNLRHFENYSTLLLIIITAFTINFLTELTSNTATTQMILPILASVSVAIGLNPLLLMITATLSASMAFMLPVATPPNTIIFASNRIKVSEMASTGILLNLTGVIIVSLLVYFLGSVVFDLSTFPSWIK